MKGKIQIEAADKRNFTVLPNHIIRCGGKPAEVLVLAIIASYAWEGSACTASIATIAAAAGVKRNTVCDAIKLWEERGQLVVERFKGKGTNIKTTFDFTATSTPWDTSIQVDTTPVSEGIPLPVSRGIHKEDTVKNTIKKTNDITPPAAAGSNSPRETFYEEMFEVQETSQTEGSKVLPVMPRDLHGGLEKDSSAQSRAAEKDERQGVRQHLPEARENQEAEVLGRKMPPESSKAPSRLRQADEGGVAVPETSLDTSPARETVQVVRPDADLIAVFDVFRESVNPTINYGNKTQRAAAEALIKAYGVEKAVSAAKLAVANFGREYWPTITNPHELREKFANLVNAYKRKSGTVGRVKYPTP